MKKQLAVMMLSMFNVSFAAGLSDRGDTNVQPAVGQKLEISHPTCLHPKPWGGDTLAEMLETRSNCLNGFVATFKRAIEILNDKGLFAGRVNTYEPEIMKILHEIFTNEGRGENWSNIPLAFQRYPNDFFKDVDGLWALIQSRDTQPDSEVRVLLENMRQPFRAVQWCSTYYWNHRATYIGDLQSSE